jgi:hypothetical protein
MEIPLARWKSAPTPSHDTRSVPTADEHADQSCSWGMVKRSLSGFLVGLAASWAKLAGVRNRPGVTPTSRLKRKSDTEVRHPPNSLGSLRGMLAVVTRAHGAAAIRAHQAAADVNSSAVLLGFSFERDHRPVWRMAFGALRDVRPITVPRNRSVGERRARLAERQCGRAPEPRFAPAHRQGGKRLAPTRGGLETPAELPHRLHPSVESAGKPAA